MKRFDRYFLYSVAIILMITGFSKIFGAQDLSLKLDEPDSMIFFLSQREVFHYFGAFELIASGFIIWNSTVLRHYFVLWMGLAFIGYRLGKYVVGSNQACGCLGVSTGWLPVSEGVLNTSLLVVSILMVIGGIAGIHRHGSRLSRGLSEETRECVAS